MKKNKLISSRSIDNSYHPLNKIDEGSYGVVYRAEDLSTGEIVAIKKLKLGKEKEGFPITSIREINILLGMEHENIIKIKEVVCGNNSSNSTDKIYTVMEYMDYELKALLTEKNYILSLSQIKCIMLQLFKGVEYMHYNWIIHRDLKTSNLLLNKEGVLKIGDFGLARKYGSPLRHYTPLVVTLWYRAPELLLNCSKYGCAVDMWSVGCIMAELFLREPLLQGQDELDQLNKIFKLLGTPTEENWPGWNTLPNAQRINFKKYNLNRLRERFPSVSTKDDIVLTDKGYDLMNKLLCCDPAKRISAGSALKHPWFVENPLPCNPSDMPFFIELNNKARESGKMVKKSLDDLQLQQREKLIDSGERYNELVNVDYMQEKIENDNKDNNENINM
jgi:cell division cycle 2-like protein